MHAFTFSQVHNEDTLAMATTFGAWMGASSQEDRVWHSAVEQLVYQESKWIAEFVRKITDTHATLKGRHHRCCCHQVYMLLSDSVMLRLHTFPVYLYFCNHHHHYHRLFHFTIQTALCVHMFEEVTSKKHVKGMMLSTIVTALDHG